MLGDAGVAAGVLLATDHQDDLSTWLIAIGFLIVWIAICWKPLKWALARQKRINAEAAKVAAETIGLREFPGDIRVQSQYAGPTSGQGRVYVSDREVRWEMDGLGGRTDSSPWGLVSTFARNGNMIHVEWTANMGGFGSSGPELAAAFQYRGNAAPQIEEAARKYLTRGTWQSDVDFGNEGKWDSFYSTVEDADAQVEPPFRVESPQPDPLGLAAREQIRSRPFGY